MKPHLQSFLRAELASQLLAWGEPAYRVDQVLRWLYAARVTRWDQMSSLPKALRARLAEAFSLVTPELNRRQGTAGATQKFLWQLEDGSMIESVLIPANPALYGEASDRHTLCVSTQVGCAYGCKFCASGLDGWKRNLHPHEIVEQVLAVERWHARERSRLPPAPPPPACPETGAGETGPDPDPGPGTPAPSARATRFVDNLVIMGMGEPLANYDNLLRALTILNAPWGGGIGARKITISTSGLAPQIRRLADEPFQFNLAISLHGATDEVRGRLMPVNRRYPLADLLAACDHYLVRKGRLLTLEYILIAGVNDMLSQVRPLAELARRLNAKLNLIPYNHVEGLAWERPTDAALEAFHRALEQQHVKVTLRREKGHEIDAACGQLRLKTERELTPPGAREPNFQPPRQGGRAPGPAAPDAAAGD